MEGVFYIPFTSLSVIWFSS